MRGFTPTLLLLLVASAQAGLVHRKNRNANSISTTAAALGAENLIPVQIIQDGQQLAPQKTAELRTPTQNGQLQPSPDAEEAPAAAPAPNAIGENIAQAVETVDSLQTTADLLESERKQDKQVVEQEITQAIAEENKELLQTVAIVEKSSELKPNEQPQQQLLKQAQEINTELKTDLPAAAAEAAAAYFSAPEIIVAAANSAEEIKSSVPLQSASLVADNLLAEAEAPNAVANELTPINQVRQAVPVAAATQATPAQSTTQQNFVQQLIQNSPLGQFFGQLAGQQQQQQQLAEQGVQVAADQPATPAPTLPGFLNPQNAITQVQNAAQSVANATAQAFQGVQQFATSLGNQFQNTLSSLGGQQQTVLSTADSTTTRPPGPIQSLINNFVGGNPPAGAAAAAGATPNPAQQQGPFQGIITFLQGGNRPQTATGASNTVAVVAPAPIGPIIPVAAAEAAAVDDKIDEVKKEDLTDAAVDEEPALIDQTDNEVRNSAEVGDDSVEDKNPDQFIIVNDDASEQTQKEDEKATVVA